jgi:NTP pyrophosphatase (non-canonical NTP hydrolase)
MPMDFDEYQEKARKTAIYPEGSRVTYPALGLAGEAGEVCELIKKSIRDGAAGPDGRRTIKIDETKVALELGDVLWYVAALAGDLGLSLGDIATMNLAKLGSRAERGVLTGSGSDR